LVAFVLRVGCELLFSLGICIQSLARIREGAASRKGATAMILILEIALGIVLGYVILAIGPWLVVALAYLAAAPFYLLKAIGGDAAKGLRSIIDFGQKGVNFCGQCGHSSRYPLCYNCDPFLRYQRQARYVVGVVLAAGLLAFIAAAALGH
jgi:hypothetical protein